MDLHRAVEILNHHRCRGRRWTAYLEKRDPYAAGDGPDWPRTTLDAFEAIAIAEAYERKARERADAVLKRPLD